MTRSLILLLLLLAPACAPAATDNSPKPAPEVARSQVERGPVRITVEVTPRKARLSDEPTLTLTLDAESGVVVRKPSFGESIGDFLVRDFHEPLPRIQAGREIRQQIYTLEPTRTGTLRIHPIPVTFEDKRPAGDGKEHAIESEALDIEIASVIGDAAPALGDAKPMAGPILLPSPPLNGALLVAALGLLAAGAGIVVLRRRRRRAVATPTPPLTPQELAARELAQLLAGGLADRDLKLFYVELTGIVRRFIERTRGVRAPEQTTEEFLREIGGKDLFAPDERARLAAFLESADLVKFAAFQPDRAQVDESCRRARIFLGLEGAGGKS